MYISRWTRTKDTAVIGGCSLNVCLRWFFTALDLKIEYCQRLRREEETEVLFIGWRLVWVLLYTITPKLSNSITLSMLVQTLGDHQANTQESFYSCFVVHLNQS